jgi:type VI secretion system protein
MGRGLLGRLESVEASTQRGGDATANIAAHLRALLNTRLGSAPTAPSYGVIDFTDLVYAFPFSISMLAASIRSTILAFEPRLKNVNVRHLPDEDLLMLKFEISGQLAEGKERSTLRFRTEVSPSGQVTLR